MTKTNRLIFAFSLVVFLGALSCSRESGGAKASSDEAPATTASATDDARGTARDTAPDASGGDTGTSAEGGEAAQVYADLLVKVQQWQRGASSSQEAFADAVAKIGKGFEDFIASYPDSPEALDAKFQLGIMYVSTQQPKYAIKYLDAYIAGTPGDRSDKAGYAHYYLAEAYKATDDFDKAKKHLEIVINDFKSMDRRFVQQAQMTLEDLAALKQLSIGSEPIPFEVTDLDGKKLSLDQYKGKVVLLDFWATWCGPCKVEMPNVIKLHKKYKDEGFDVVGISLDRDRSAVERYVSTQHLDWRHHFDGKGWQNGVAMKYKIRSIPATFLIDRQGKIRYRSIRGPQLEAAVEKLLKETS